MSATLDDVLMTEPPPDSMSRGIPYLQPRKVPKRSRRDDAPELFLRRLGDRSVDRGGASGVVVQHVEPAEPVHRPIERGPDASRVGDVCLDPDRFAACGPDPFLRLRARGRIDLGHDDARTLAGKQLRRPSDRCRSPAPVMNATLPSSRSVTTLGLPGEMPGATGTRPAPDRGER